MKTVKQNVVAEFSYSTGKSYANPFHDVAIAAVVTGPDGATVKVPGFWAGNGVWKLRYASPNIGIHTFRTVCSDAANAELHGQEGTVEVVRYDGDNPLYKHGAVKPSANRRYLEHQDGKPFLWLGDTWWMGLTKRLRWPEDFQSLVSDRQAKGFSVIQIIAGLYPDMDPFDERGANEAGFPWDRDFRSVNPAYFDEADLKFAYLVESGLVPCIVGCWGFFVDFAGPDAIRKHWEYLIARYGAYPVVWCAAGEALMPFYTNPAFGDKAAKEQYTPRVRKQWTELTRFVKSNDPFGRLLTIHPTDYGRDMVDEPELLDLDMLQTGHGSFNSLAPTANMIVKSVNRQPAMPVINSEVCYEGICGSNYQDVQRFAFWSCMLSGACGHTYGANGIWQMNAREMPYGPSPHGAAWGNTPWQEAAQLPGSTQVGLGKRLLDKYRWWEFAPQPEWVERHANENNRIAPYAAGIPGQVRVIFLSYFGGSAWGEIVVRQLEPDVTYRAYYFDPVTGTEYDQGIVVADSQGQWKSGRTTLLQDWVLVLENSGGA